MDLRTNVRILAYAELEDVGCRCGKRKPARRAFCGACWDALGEQTQRALNDRDRNRFPKSYLLALQELKLVDPAKFERAIAALG